INTATAAVSATSYSCTEGAFGSGVGANTCGNYSLGFNNIDESTRTDNFGGNANCLDITTGGDDGAPVYGPNPTNGGPRGLTEHSAAGGCIATVGAYDHTHILYDNTGSGGQL